MKVSKLIKIANEFFDRYGDLDVVHDTFAFDGEELFQEDLTRIEIKDRVTHDKVELVIKII